MSALALNPPVPHTPVVRCRVMQTRDLDDAMRVQTECHLPQNLEDLATLAQRLCAAPDTAWVAEVDGRVQAYLVGHRARLGHIAHLGQAFAPAPMANCLYLHDLAVSPRARGLGLAQALLDRAWALALREELAHAALVSLGDAVAFWNRQGFVPDPHTNAAQRDLLASYAGGTACYMRRDCAPLANRPSTARG